jgi:hypothetical protein
MVCKPLILRGDMILENEGFLLNSIKSSVCTKDIGWQGVFGSFV